MVKPDKEQIMKKRTTSPDLLEGDDLERWYLRTPDEVELERDAGRMRHFQEFFGASDQGRSEEAPEESVDNTRFGDYSGWEEARVSIRPVTPVIPSPGGVRIAIPTDATSVPATGLRGGFFDTHSPVPNPALGPAYFTDLPRPLNIVTPKVGGWFELGDGTLVKGADEVERIHAEQQGRMRGKEDSQPAARVRASDRFRDGVVPKADQLEKNQRELDATCHPYGGWERDDNFRTYSERSRRYQAQITRAPGLDYVVRNPVGRPVKFDGCAVWDPRHQLLEAKGPGYAGLEQKAKRSTFLESLQNGPVNQARNQARAAGERPVEWHVAEPGAVSFFKDILKPYSTIRLRQTPAR